MSISEIRARIAPVPSGRAKTAVGPDVRKANTPAMPSAQADQPLEFRLAFFSGDGLDIRTANASATPPPQTDRPVESKVGLSADEFDIRTANASATPLPQADRPLEPESRSYARGRDVQKTNAPTPLLPDTELPLDLQDWQPPREPWLARNFRTVGIVALLVAAAGMTYGYFYWQRALGPSPLEGAASIIDRVTSAPEDARRGESVGSITYAPSVERSQQSSPPAKPVAARPVAPTTASEERVVRAKSAAGVSPSAPMTSAPSPGAMKSHVTHTNPGVAAPTTPIPSATRQAATAVSAANEPPGVGARAIVPRDQPKSDACTEAVAALGLCKPQVGIEGR